MLKLTFQDRLKFNGFSNYVANPSRHVPDLSGRPNVIRTDGKKTWKAVDFAPRFHQVRLGSAKLDFSRSKCVHNRAISAKREAVKRASLEELIGERNRRSWRCQTKNTRVESNVFHTRFHPLTPRDEDVQRAKTWRSYQTYPYTNPRPFDHRGVSEWNTNMAWCYEYTHTHTMSCSWTPIHPAHDWTLLKLQTHSTFN